MIKQQDDNELDRSAAELAEASVSPADGELPLCPGDASVSTGNVEPNGDESDARMAQIEEILGHAAMRLLEKCALVAEWVRHAEAKLSVFGHFVQKPQGGRPESGVARAARELPIPGKSIGARRKFIERALKIHGMEPEVKVAARAAGLDDRQSVLLEIASERSSEAQLAKVQEIAAAKTQPRRDGGGSTANRAKAEAEQLKAELAAANERQRQLEEELETARVTALESRVASPIKISPDLEIPPFLDRRPLSTDDQAAFDSIMAAWTNSAAPDALLRASPVVQERFIATVRAEIDSARSATN
jgi:hypothetical protein